MGQSSEFWAKRYHYVIKIGGYIYPHVICELLSSTAVSIISVDMTPAQRRGFKCYTQPREGNTVDFECIFTTDSVSDYQ